MITVRFPTGVSVQYNDAAVVERGSDYSDLYTNRYKTCWVAQVPNSAIIEIRSACAVYTAPDQSSIEKILDLLTRIERSLPKRKWAR
jgi:hypothetical protein